MKCVIPGLNIKLFARAIHSLSRIGDELFVEPSNSGVYFRTVNSSRSAFGSYFFKQSFFLHFDFSVTNLQEEESFKCKVAMKACLNAFKSVNNMERSVEKCKLIIDPEEDRLVVNMSCRHGISKSYNLSFIECETLQVVFDRKSCGFGITTQSRVLCDAFVNFQHSQEEVTLSVTPQKISIRNYVDDDPDPAKSIHTELSLDSDEFDNFDINQNCEITFCLKEVRSFLSFSEPANLPICLNFSNPGSPIIFSVENPYVFEANFVLATLSSGENTQSSNRSQKCGKNIAKNSVKRPEIVSLDGIGRNFSKRASSLIDDFSSRVEMPETSKYESNSSKFNSPLYSERGRRESLKLPSLNPVKINQSILETDERHDEEDDEVVPGTPPAKRRKFFFKRCFEPTFDPNNISKFKRILAEDSDEDV